MRTKIGAYDDVTKMVAVTFAHAGVKHSRTVKACLDAGGAYDAAATRARVREVALGVVVKIAKGVISSPARAGGGAHRPLTVDSQRPS